MSNSNKFLKITVLIFSLTVLPDYNLFGEEEEKAIPILKQKIEEVAGQVHFFDNEKRIFIPVKAGMVINKPLLFKTGSQSEMIFSCVGNIAVRASEHASFVLSPPENNRYEVELRKGALTASLRPNRPIGAPVFAIRTLNGVTEATGTLFAVAEYKGQTYTSVKKGEVKKQTVPPGKPDFSAYLTPPKSNKSNAAISVPVPATKK